MSVCREKRHTGNGGIERPTTAFSVKSKENDTNIGGVTCVCAWRVCVCENELNDYLFESTLLMSAPQTGRW